MRSEWPVDDRPDGTLLPLVTGICIALPVGIALGIFIGVKVVLGAGW